MTDIGSEAVKSYLPCSGLRIAGQAQGIGGFCTACWQITPRVLTEALAVGGDEARRAFDAMMGMKKIDVAAIKAARRG